MEMDRVGYYCTDVAEDKEGGFSYVHRLRKGVNRQSHALKVARLAGLPEAAIDVARQLLKSDISFGGKWNPRILDQSSASVKIMQKSNRSYTLVNVLS